MVSIVIQVHNLHLLYDQSTHLATDGIIACSIRRVHPGAHDNMPPQGSSTSVHGCGDMHIYLTRSGIAHRWTELEHNGTHHIAITETDRLHPSLKWKANPMAATAQCVPSSRRCRRHDDLIATWEVRDPSNFQSELLSDLLPDDRVFRPPAGTSYCRQPDRVNNSRNE